MSAIPVASATVPAAVPAHGCVRLNTSCAIAAEPARAKTLTPPTKGSVVWCRPSASWGPSDSSRPPIDHEEVTPSAAAPYLLDSSATVEQLGVTATPWRQALAAVIQSYRTSMPQPAGAAS
jgi:hypothetical protein